MMEAFPWGSIHGRRKTVLSEPRSPGDRRADPATDAVLGSDPPRHAGPAHAGRARTVYLRGLDRLQDGEEAARRRGLAAAYQKGAVETSRHSSNHQEAPR